MGTVQFKRQVGLEILIFAVLISITALVIKPVEAYAERAMSRLRDYLIGKAEQVLDRTIRYASARPSIVGSLDIQDVSVYGSGDEALLKLERFRTEYSVFALLTGKKTGAIRLVSLEGIEFSYDLDNDRNLAELFTAGGERPPLVLPEECLLELRRGAVLIKKGDRSITVTDLYFDGQIRDGRIVFDGSWHTEAALAGLAGSLNAIAVDGGLAGDFSRDFSGGNLMLSVSAIQADTFELENLVFDFSIHENVVELRHSTEKPADSADGAPGSGDGAPDSGETGDFPRNGVLGITLTYNLDTGVFSGELRPDNFAPGEILRFLGDWKRYDPWLSLAVNGNASFSVDGRDKIAYRFDLRGSGDSEYFPAFDFAGFGGDEKIVFDRLSLAFSGRTLGYSGDIQFDPFIPEGILRFEDFGFGEGPGLDGELRFTRSGRELGLFSENFSAAGAVLSSVSGGLIWEESGCTYTLELFRSGNAVPDDQTVSVLVMGSYDRFQPEQGRNSPGQLQGSVALNLFPAADIITMAGMFSRGERVPVFVEKLAGDTAVTAEIFVSTDFEHISYNVPECTVVYKGFSEISTTGSISGNDGRFEVSDGRIAWKNAAADIALMADFSNPDNVSFFVQTTYKDFAYYFEGTFFDRRTLSIRGSYGISVYVSAAESGSYSGYIDIASAPVPFRGRTALLGVDAAARFDSVSSWNLNINSLEFRENENPALQFTDILVSGTANQDGADIGRVFYGDRFGELSGSIQADWERDFSAVWGRLLLLGEGENYILEAAYQNDGGASVRNGKNGRAAFGLQLSAVQLDRFLPGGKGGRLSGTADGIWNAFDSYEIDMNLDSMEVPGMAVASARVSINQDLITIRDARAEIRELNAKSSVFVLDRSRSVFEMSAEFDGTIKGREVGLEVSLSAFFAPIDSWFGIAGALNGLGGSLDVKDARLGNARLSEPCLFRFSRSGEGDSGFVTRISGGPEDMFRFELLGDGSLYMDLAAPSPVQASVTGTFRDFIIDAYSDEVFIDLPALWVLIPKEEIVVFTSGFITGKTTVSGSIFDPEFSGSAWGSGVRLRIPQYLPEEIGSASGAITLDGSEIYFGPLKAACGKGGGEVSVSLRFNRWIPSWDIDVLVPEQQSIPFAFDVSGIKAGGSVSGNVRLAFENDETLTITGLVHAEDTVITIDADKISAFREGTGNDGNALNIDVIADLRVTAGRRVEFLWPNEDFPLIRAYGASGTGLRFAADTRIPQFVLDGDILLQGGEIYYFQRSFFIREGQLFFNPNDSRIDPIINARAEIRERNDEGPVIISMIADGVPLSSFSPRFESNPPLSQLEIYDLLGQTSPEGQGSEVIVRTFSDALTQFAVVRRVERQIRNILGLDMFTVRIQVLQNALLQAMNDDPERERRTTIGNYFDNTAVYMGKYIGSDLFIQAIIAMRYDPYRTENGGLRFEPDIGLDFRTPFADIRWNISPRHPEHLYVSDQSLSLMWRWSF
ncbi:MAG: translocation/assembly module TamB domain-containing protein [Treponema sp.]|nr:translocation/assembly module TamB domain-containing protein [Treponema sp.]